MKINEQEQGKRLDNYLCTKLNLSRSEIQKGEIFVNGELKKPSYKLKLNDEIIFKPIQKEEIKAQNIPLDIVFEDDELLVINKPKNMLTHPTSHDSENTLVNALLAHTKLSEIGAPLRSGIVHRLDKNTSGLLVVAKTNEAHANLAQQIKTREMKRKYHAIALGNFTQDEGTINKPIAKHLGKKVKMYIDEKGAPSITHYKVLERFNSATFLELQLETGRTHQIRVHLSSENHPIFGDSLYGANSWGQFSKIKTQEQVLQSYYISFTHPTTGAKMEFQIEEDDDLKKVLQILRKDFK